MNERGMLIGKFRHRAEIDSADYRVGGTNMDIFDEIKFTPMFSRWQRFVMRVRELWHWLPTDVEIEPARTIRPKDWESGFKLEADERR